ncbi:carbamate kinase [Agrobacterium sp. DE0009]|uniref:carbamate kinase n=1 Tax=Agrobacterium sp. DE0009 TaxID=2587505 RepID=UPI0011A8198D|nr:carbamate kinase [Agrobacterium sp. DE0009]
MLIVTALGGNALLRRGQPLSAKNQRENVAIAARSLAPVAMAHKLVIGHGNGPQVGLLALQSAAYGEVEPYPFDVLGAQTEGMIGYMIEQELGNLLPFHRPIATLLTMVEVDGADPAFANPTKFIGPVLTKAEADLIRAEKGWTFKMDGQSYRRVVASPKPRRIFELRPIRWLLDQNTVVIAAGGGGIPTMYTGEDKKMLVGVECVIDKDLAAELMARELEADFLAILTDVDSVYVGWGTPHQRAIRTASPDALEEIQFPAGSMGPKVEAACRFVRATGNRACIGSLKDLAAMIEGTAGTTVTEEVAGITYAPARQGEKS